MQLRRRHVPHAEVVAEATATVAEAAAGVRAAEVRAMTVRVGVGKAADTQLAIEKATRAAKRNMIHLSLTKNRSIPFNVESKYCASVVEIRPSPGRGLVAGSSVRSVLELAGVTDVTAKLLSRSKNPINNARAAIQALKSLPQIQ
ncbi:MAG: 30S ribosomal protein S5 [Candidatus Giovannonibacteria bacterium GW2011_GWA2_53_7]|uniref:Small ribosomal subunit protein uS5 n=1 Tax=Candidatus Giovannonibacteria bacterium GW2011_GWA2_53_7 TaxID=1618650 RepID=A0A0G1XUC2_9BACT|nr:MAG: 30S ribosomal protein S5 [Candidatus Giovannonibacteria bacterium GW2011_GWA2_53_7]